MDDLLSKDDVVTRFSFGDEIGLEAVDEVVEVGFDFVNEDFGDSFVEGVTKAYRSELVDGFWLFDFWQEANQGRVPIL